MTTTTPITDGLKRHREESANAFIVRKVSSAAKELTLNDLRERMETASGKLSAMLADPHTSLREHKRLKGKIEGVRLAQSYVDEALRTLDR